MKHAKKKRLSDENAERNGGLNRIYIRGKLSRKAEALLRSHLRRAAMGEIRATVLLENNHDIDSFERGRIARDVVRSCEIVAVADTGAVATLIPHEVVDALGLKIGGTCPVLLANDQQIELPFAGGLRLTVAGRWMETDCFVGPAGCEALIGQIVMERLDLIADPGRKTLLPRLESGPVLKMKELATSHVFR